MNAPWRTAPATSSATTSCEAALYTHTCSTWPPQELATNVDAVLLRRMQSIVADLMASFPAGVESGDLDLLMRRPCMQRLCVHVQLFGGRLYVVSPEGMELCARGGDIKARLSCTAHSSTTADGMGPTCSQHRRQAGHKRSRYCNRTSRLQQIGVTIPGFWDDRLYPHLLEWHFAASLNLSSCRSSGAVPLPGDHNHVFTRLRLQSALRLLLRAYQRLHASGQLRKPVELILCPNETPINFGDWCVAGPQPIFSSTTNEHAAVIPFVQWVQATGRDEDFAYWSPNAGPGHQRLREQWQHAEPRAVFRGSVHRLSVYSDHWRDRGPARTQVTRSNWREIGRTAVLAAKLRRPDLLNVRLLSYSVEAREGLDRALMIAGPLWKSMDKPESMTAEEQRQYRYTINAEGHGGWADRGYKLFLQPQLVLVQDMPALPWYHRFLRPFEHYLPVDANFKNLTDAVLWAQAHDDQARSMVEAANKLTHKVLQPRAIFRYAEEVLLGYSRLLKYRPTLHPRAIMFKCEDSTASNRTCTLRRGKGSVRVHLGETQCFFASREGSTRRHHTLYGASLAHRLTSAKLTSRSHSPSVLQVMRSSGGHQR